MDVYVGIDCGATNCRVGLVSQEGHLLLSTKFHSPLKNNPLNFGQVIKEHLEQLLKPDWQLKAIGVGTPGPLNIEKGLLMPSSNLGNTEMVNLGDQFESLFDVPIYFDRDTNVALLGEAWVGAAKDAQDAVMLTLGSGVGGALLINGEIERGASGKAGEVGHMMIGIPESTAGDSQGVPVCGLGHNGCLEAWVNSAKDLEELSYYLGLGLANIVDIFNPQKIIIGGGKIHMGDFLPKAIEIMKDNGTKGAVDEVEVLYAKLGDSSGIYGAAKMAIDNLKQ